MRVLGFLPVFLLASFFVTAQESDSIVDVLPVMNDSAVQEIDTLIYGYWRGAECHRAEEAGERALYVKVTEGKLPAVLRIAYRVGIDTLYDAVAVDSKEWTFVKHWPLLKGDTLCTWVVDSGYSVNVEYRNDGFEKVIQNENYRGFTGDVWHYKDVALLRISKNRKFPERLNVVVGLKPGFDFDRIYLSVKIIHPTEGVKEVEKEVRVIEAESLGKTSRLLRVYIPEWVIEEPGDYFLRVSHQHLNDRLNGIDFVSYELLTP
jgi:hypothetical protein